MRRLILGTAGHIDHGKTTLVKALTGIDTDRLPEEKARGITIDLGFAFLDLGDIQAGIVDVPGHEGLIRNMLAGATGFDAALLVIAADEGIMPQTREHLLIARLLGMEALVVAVTKTETVEGEWLELVRADVAAFVSAAGFANPPILNVSARSGAGLGDLRSALTRVLNGAVQRSENDIFRMPIDRVFTVRGTGTVVTGTIWSGSAGHDEAAGIYPGTRQTRIRGVQSDGQPVERAGAGQRAAFALVGIDKADVARGHVLVRSAGWQDTFTLTAHIRMLDQPLKPRQRVRIHLGTAEVMARVVLLADDWIQLRTESPVLARVGDRFVIRAYSPVRTLGGGVVAEIERVRKRLSADELSWLAQAIAGTPAQRLTAALQLAGQQGITSELLPLRTGLAPPEIERVLAAADGDVVHVNQTYYTRPIIDAAATRITAAVQHYHDQHPLKPGIERAELLHLLPPPLNEGALTAAEHRGSIVRSESLVAVPGFVPSLSPAQRTLRGRLAALLREGGLAPSTVPELEHTLGSTDVRAVLRLLEGEGEIVRVSQDVYINAAVLNAAVRQTRTALAGRELTAGDFRTVLPVSRKYLIPLLEYLDRTGVTRREGDLRRVVGLEPPESA